MKRKFWLLTAMVMAFAFRVNAMPLTCAEIFESEAPSYQESPVQTEKPTTSEEFQRASHETRGAIFNKMKELYVQGETHSAEYQKYLNDKYSGVEFTKISDQHNRRVVELSKEISDLAAVELTRHGYGVEVFQPPIARADKENLNSYLVRVRTFPPTKAGKFWRSLERRYKHELIFNPKAEVLDNQGGGVTNTVLYHSLVSIIFGAPERFISLFHEIVHLNERQKIKDGKPSNFSMQFKLSELDFDLPMGYRKWFTLDEILASEMENSLYNSEAYKSGYLRTGIFENLSGEKLDTKFMELRNQVQRFSHWTSAQMGGLISEVRAGKFIVEFDKERQTPYATIQIVTYKKRWFGLKKERDVRGTARVYLAPEWAQADKDSLQNHLLERLSATQVELLTRLK